MSTIYAVSSDAAKRLLAFIDDLKIVLSAFATLMPHVRQFARSFVVAAVVMTSAYTQFIDVHMARSGAEAPLVATLAAPGPAPVSNPSPISGGHRPFF